MNYSLPAQQLKQEIQTLLSLASRELNFGHLALACLVGVAIGTLLLISPLLALFVTLGVIVCIIALLRPILLCYMIIGTIALTSGMQRGKLIPVLKPNEVILLLSAGIAFVIILTRKTYQSVNLHSISAAITVLVSGTMLIPGISYLIRGTPLTVQDGLVLLAPLQYVLLFWLFTYLPSNGVERRRIIQLMLLCGAAVAAIGLLQGARFGFVTNLIHLWYGSTHEMNAATAGRVTSLMSSWNTLGIFLMVNLFIAWAFGISMPTDMGNGLIAVAIGLCSAGLAVSGSFAGVIGSILGIFIITFFLRGINRKTIILLVVLSIVILVAIIFFKPLMQERLNAQFGYGGWVPQTLLYRLKVWREIYLPAVQQNLLWGINPTVPSSFSWQYTESQYLTLLFSFGLVGFIAHLMWIGILLIWLFRRFRQHHSLLKPVTVIAITILLVLSVAGFTNAVFTYAGTADYLWIILAMVTANEDDRVPTTAEPF